MNLVELSQRIKQRRLKLGLSLETAATLAGQTTSWLSKVENFRITPSLPALARLAETLQVSVSELVEGLDQKPKFLITRKSGRKAIERDKENSNIAYFSLVSDPASRHMSPFLLDIPALGGRTVSRSHEGEEFLLVLRGRVEMEFDGESYSLREGDSLYFDARVPHRVYNTTKRAAQVLCVFGD